MVQVPRFPRSAYYRGADPRAIGAKDGATAGRMYNADQQQPHIGVKDPARQHVVFRSSVQRFPEDMPSFEARGLHPQMKKAQVRECHEPPHLIPSRPPPTP